MSRFSDPQIVCRKLSKFSWKLEEPNCNSSTHLLHKNFHRKLIKLILFPLIKIPQTHRNSPSPISNPPKKLVNDLQTTPPLPSPHSSKKVKGKMIIYCQKSFFCIKYILIKFQIKSSLERNNQIIYGGNRALHKFKFLGFFPGFL